MAGRNLPRGRMVNVILAGVSAHHMIDAADMLGHSRRLPIVQARLEAYWLMSQIAEMSYEAIGVAVGDRDRTTVRSGLKQIERRRASDAEFANHLSALAETISEAVNQHGVRQFAMIDQRELDRLQREANAKKRLEDKRAQDHAEILRLERRLQRRQETASLRSLLGAYDRFQQDRYGSRERHALDNLLTSLSHLKAEMTSAKGASS